MTDPVRVFEPEHAAGARIRAGHRSSIAYVLARVLGLGYK